jgi:ribonuclease P protein component
LSLLQPVAAYKLRVNAVKLTRPSEFKAVLAGSLRLSGAHFLLRAETSGQPAARLGLIASRKSARRAVDRNRGKRIAREAFRARQPGLPAVDIVVQLKDNLRSKGNRVLRQELERLLDKLGARFGSSGTGGTSGASGQVGAATSRRSAR